MTGVEVTREDSRTFLKRVVEELSEVGARPFFYLDAHGGKGRPETPLLDEIAAVLRFAEFVVMIDDFAVPGAAFKYDTWESIPSIGCTSHLMLPLLRSPPLPSAML
jgi:hypothetical protein